MNTVLVRERVFATGPDSVPFEITIEIGTPVPYDDRREEWICPVSFPPLEETVRSVHGSSQLQSLSLAIYVVYQALTDFRTEGGRLSYAQGGEDDYALKATFGRMLDDPTEGPATRFR